MWRRPRPMSRWRTSRRPAKSRTGKRKSRTSIARPLAGRAGFQGRFRPRKQGQPRSELDRAHAFFGDAKLAQSRFRRHLVAAHGGACLNSGTEGGRSFADDVEQTVHGWKSFLFVCPRYGTPSAMPQCSILQARHALAAMHKIEMKRPHHGGGAGSKAMGWRAGDQSSSPATCDSTCPRPMARRISGTKSANAATLSSTAEVQVEPSTVQSP